MQKTAIIIPCYNEEERLNEIAFLNSLESNNHHFYIFVDDCSHDGTWKKLECLKNSNPSQIHLLHLEKNMGKAEAVRQGFLKAFDLNFEFVGFWDADLSTPLSSINDLLNLMDNQKVSIVMGSRVRLLGRNIRRSNSRHYMGRLFATLASIVLGIPVYDTQCGSKIFRNTAEIKSIFNKPFGTRWIFDVEILTRYKHILKSKYSLSISDSVIEHPLKEWFDVSGSKLRIFDFIFAPYALIKIYLCKKVVIFK